MFLLYLRCFQKCLQEGWRGRVKMLAVSAFECRLLETAMRLEQHMFSSIVFMREMHIQADACLRSIVAKNSDFYQIV